MSERLFDVKQIDGVFQLTGSRGRHTSGYPIRFTAGVAGNGDPRRRIYNFAGWKDGKVIHLGRSTLISAQTLRDFYKPLESLPAPGPGEAPAKSKIIIRGADGSEREATAADLATALLAAVGA